MLRLCAVPLGCALFGCSSAPTAELGAKAPDAVQAKGAVERYDLAGHTEVQADVSAGAAYTLTFRRFGGTLTIAPETPEASAIDLSIETASAEASWSLVADVARDEFLHTAQFPEARFTSRALRKNAKGAFELFGDLTLHGTTLPLSAPAELDIQKCSVTAHTEFAIDRRAFGAISTGNLDGVVSDSVVIRITATVPRVRPGC